MSTLSDVSLLIAENAVHLELAREVFTTETRRFVESALGGVRRARSDPWTSGRIKVDLPDEIETESKAVANLHSQFALARPYLRFKRQTKFVVVAEVPFGIVFDESANAFAWQVSLVPAAKYTRLDDVVWRAWLSAGVSLPDAKHQERANTVRFVSRAVSKDLSLETLFGDVKTALEFLLGLGEPLAEVVGLDEPDTADQP